jgi:hypothetical protein
MSSKEDSKRVTKRRSYGEGSNRGTVRWNHLSDEKREQYERIEERVREKMERGEL